MKYYIGNRTVFPRIKNRIVLVIALKPWNDISSKTWNEMSRKTWGTV